MTSLPQRLEGLIGPKPEVICTGVDCPGCNHGRQQTRAKELSHSILEDMLAIVGEDEYSLELKHGAETDDIITETAAIRNELKAKIRAALTAYCIGEGEKPDAKTTTPQSTSAD